MHVEGGFDLPDGRSMGGMERMEGMGGMSACSNGQDMQTPSTIAGFDLSNDEFSPFIEGRDMHSSESY